MKGYRGELDGLVLGVLQSGPAHGYEIAKRVRVLSEGIMSAGEAKLYACLHRLEDEGLVTAEWIPQEGKPARKVYTITAKGGGVLKAKRAAWREFANAVETMLAPATKEDTRG
jgi:PadR family transcriptional regulator, regulatory protein PadR